jgi:membrane associated rhomboid family serine protease
MSLTEDVKYKLTRLNVLEKVIAANVIIFAVIWLLKNLFRISTDSFLKWFELPRELGDMIMQPWSIFTYGFLHYDFMHIFFNMLVLYMVGRIFLNLLNPKMALNVYLLGILFGGAFFLLGYALFPSSIFKSIGSLIGASAGVRAILIFLCAYMPQTEVRIIKFNIKLWYFGAAFVVIDLIGVFYGNNSGGNMAHLGGALLGYLYATQLQKGKDIGRGFEKFMDSIAALFKTKSRSKLKTVHKAKKGTVAGHTKKEFNEFSNQKKIDLILDKISKSGYESLTQEEKEFLFKAGKNQQ